MREAAEALRLTAQDLHKLGVCDRIIEEPVGGAQRDRGAAIAAIGVAIGAMLAEVDGLTRDARLAARRRKVLDMGRTGLA
jgi:acetyl-CoA carboxylase carboxyl transferase subunit alpha